jgi:hypothetical protein
MGNLLVALKKIDDVSLEETETFKLDEALKETLRETKARLHDENEDTEDSLDIVIITKETEPSVVDKETTAKDRLGITPLNGTENNLEDNLEVQTETIKQATHEQTDMMTLDKVLKETIESCRLADEELKETETNLEENCPPRDTTLGDKYTSDSLNEVVAQEETEQIEANIEAVETDDEDDHNIGETLMQVVNENGDLLVDSNFEIMTDFFSDSHQSSSDNNSKIVDIIEEGENHKTDCIEILDEEIPATPGLLGGLDYQMNDCVIKEDSFTIENDDLGAPTSVVQVEVSTGSDDCVKDPTEEGTVVLVKGVNNSIDYCPNCTLRLCPFKGGYSINCVTFDITLMCHGCSKKVLIKNSFNEQEKSVLWMTV